MDADNVGQASRLSPLLILNRSKLRSVASRPSQRRESPGRKRQVPNLTEESGICLRFHPSPGFQLRSSFDGQVGGQVEASARQAEQLRFREHATKSVLNNSFVPIPLSSEFRLHVSDRVARSALRGPQLSTAPRMPSGLNLQLPMSNGLFTPSPGFCITCDLRALRTHERNFAKQKPREG
jgi:hypothetical protein